MATTATLKLDDNAQARRAIREAFVNGALADWLMKVDYRAAMGRPLAEVRERLRIRAPKHYRSAEDARH